MSYKDVVCLCFVSFIVLSQYTLCNKNVLIFNFESNGKFNLVGTLEVKSNITKNQEY